MEPETAEVLQSKVENGRLTSNQWSYKGGIMWRKLSLVEVQNFRTWARLNFSPGDPINPTWHPVVQSECHRMEIEAIKESDWIEEEEQ